MKWHSTAYNRYDYVNEDGEIFATILQGHREWMYKDRRFINDTSAKKAVEKDFDMAGKDIPIPNGLSPFTSVRDC